MLTDDTRRRFLAASATATFGFQFFRCHLFGAEAPRDKLNLAAIGYTMLHTAALAMDDVVTAELALGHLSELTPLVMEVSKVMPSAVVNDLIREVTVANPDAAAPALRNTQQAWRI